MSFQEKFDFDFIFPTTFDAVRLILKEYDPLQNESIDNQGIIHRSVNPPCSIVYPSSIYKNKSPTDENAVAWF